MIEDAARRAVPDGFRLLSLPEQGYMDVNGPLYGRLEGNKLSIGLRVEERHCNPAMVCHGGMLMTLADMQLALGSNYEGEMKRFLPTINLSADYLAPAPLGSWLSGASEILRRTRNLLFAQCLIEADGVLVLRANGIMKISPEPDPKLDLSRLFV